MIVGVTCQQGSGCSFYSVSSRLVIIQALLVLLFLYASFSANIVGLIQSPSTRIKTLNDLLESKLRVAYQDTDYNRFYFRVGGIVRFSSSDVITVQFSERNRTRAKSSLRAENPAEGWVRCSIFHGGRCEVGSSRTLCISRRDWSGL